MLRLPSTWTRSTPGTLADVQLVDANVLVAAQRSDHVHHDPCRVWLESAVTAGERIALTELAVAAFLRVVTHPGVFDPPTTSSDALDMIDGLLARPNVAWLTVSPAQLDVLEDLLDDPGAAGRMLPDSWIAAAAIANGATLVTLDRDFARFAGLRTMPPSAPDGGPHP